MIDWTLTEKAGHQVPNVITRAQGKAALIRNGLWPQTLALVEAMPPEEKAMAEVALFDTNEWRRASPFLGVCAEALGLTPAQLDELFIQAQGIEL